jgi:hypothetical protein
LKRSLLLRVQVFHIESLHLRARALLAVGAEASKADSFLQAAERDAARIEREGMPWGNAFAKLLRAGIASTRAQREAAITLLNEAEIAFQAADMGLYAAVASRCRGQLIGNEGGRELIEKADIWMANQQIKNCARMAAMLAPGKWQS